MKKWLLVMLASGLLAAPLQAVAAPIQVTVNGQPVYFDQPPVQVGGRVLVPVRGVFQGLGASVTWNPGTRTVTALRGQDIVVLPLGSTVAQVDGQNRYLDQPAQIIGGRTLVPLRFISEALGARVQWLPYQSLVAVTSAASQETYIPNPPAPEEPGYRWPLIESVTVDRSGAVYAGHDVDVRMDGQAGGRAVFSVGGRRSEPMEEVEPGHYRGTYTVRYNDNNPYAVVSATLTMPDGEQQTAEAPVTVGVFGFASEPLPIYGQSPNVYFHSLEVPTTTLWLGNQLRISFQGPPGGRGFLDVGGMQIPLAEQRPGFYQAVYAPQPGFQPGVVPMLVAFQPPNAAQPQRVMLPQPLYLMPPTLPAGRLIAQVQPVPPAAPGHPLVVQMTAAPGARATFNVGAHDNLPMRETRPGHYEGTYTPRPGEAVTNARVTARVALPHGPSATAQAAAPVSLTAAPPPAVVHPPISRPVPVPPPPAARVPSPPQAVRPPVAVRVPPPPRQRLQEVQLQGPSTLVPGDVLQVTALATSGGRATFDLGGHVGLPLPEVRPGEYHATYRVQPGDAFNRAPALIHVTWPDGQQDARTTTQRVSVQVRPAPAAGRPAVAPGLGVSRVDSNLRGPARAGQTVVITAQGTPHATALLILGNQSLPMLEVAPGTYQTQFQVPPVFRPETFHTRVQLRSGAEMRERPGPDVRVTR